MRALYTHLECQKPCGVKPYRENGVIDSKVPILAA
jgi:hypothetical protein